MEEIKHSLTPKHVPLSDEEAKKVLEAYNISKTQLPQIYKKDPAIAHLGLKTGTVIKIVRKSETALKTNFFRVVI